MDDFEIHKLEDKVDDSQKDIADLKLIVSNLGTEMNSLKKEISNRVSYKMFWIIVGALVACMTTLLAVIYDQNQKLGEKMGRVQQDVSFIQGSINQLLKTSISNAKE